VRNRKPNRMPGYDYSTPGFYFITICVKYRVQAFGKVDNGIMRLNEYGEIVKRQWFWLGEQYPYIALDEFVVMQDHVHGILGFVYNGIMDTGYISGPEHTVAGRDLSLREIHKIKPLHEIIGAFKTTSSKQIHITGYNEFKWQRSFYDTIIRNERQLYNIRNYIKHNPSLYPKNKTDIEKYYSD
jgi:putative transposase